MNSSSEYGNYNNNSSWSRDNTPFLPPPPLPREYPPMPPDPNPGSMTNFSREYAVSNNLPSNSNDGIVNQSSIILQAPNGPCEPYSAEEVGQSTWRYNYPQSNQYTSSTSNDPQQYPNYDSYSQNNFMELNDSYGNGQVSQEQERPCQPKFNSSKPWYHGRDSKSFVGSRSKPYKRVTQYQLAYLPPSKSKNPGANNSILKNGEHNGDTSSLSSLEIKNKDSKEGNETKSLSVPDNRRLPPVTIDPNLPEVIASKMKSSVCDICFVPLNSRIQAKTHYAGKAHAKKIKNAVEQHKLDNLIALSSFESLEEPSVVTPSEATDVEPPVKRKKYPVTDGSKLYCKCCDLSFTSNEHATQHYLGRNHQRVLHGLKPLKAGYYNKNTGKWQRSPPDPRVPTELLSDGDDDNDIDSVKDKGKFFCELCGVSATSQDQLDGHLTGQRHSKRVQINKLNMSKKISQPEQEESGIVDLQDSILASVIKGHENEARKLKAQDLSIYRTPSGKYYCSPCDITLNSECQFAQHIESKKHKMKKK